MSRPSYFMFATHTVSASGAGVGSGMDIRTEGTAASSTNSYRSKKFSAASGQIGFTLKSTGTLTGTWTLWYSDEETPSTTDETGWAQDSNFNPTNPAGSPTYKKYAVDGLKTRWYKVRYTNDSGTGSIYGYADGDAVGV